MFNITYDFIRGWNYFSVHEIIAREEVVGALS